VGDGPVVVVAASIRHREARLAVGVAAEVKSRLNIVDVVGETVALKKAGTTFKGLCPFHGEKTPSFVVTPSRDSWHCFGCGLGGDVFSFVMQRDSIAFPDALKVLAAKAGVELDERTRREDARRARIREVTETAIAFYHTVLLHRTGQPALAYLHERGFTDETIERFQLGWAPGGWDTMSRTLQARRGITPAELAEAGLTTSRDGSRSAYDKFRNRVIFPIRDANGSAVGLGGRILESSLPPGREGGPKYLNSPATPIFDKSRTLYLIDKAKGAIRKGGQAVIVEGYTDALMAHQAGFDNVVASLGTALTPGQVALLTRYAKRIALAYDVDPAGERAGTLGVQALESLIGELGRGESGVELDEVRVVRLPEGKDPDEVVRADPSAWEAAVKSAAPIVDYLIDHHARQVDMKTPGGRARFVDAILPTIRSIPSPVMRDGYLQQVRQVSGVEERVLHEALQLGRGGGPGGGGPGGRAGGARASSRGGSGNGSDGRITAEAVLASPDALPIGEILRSVTPVEVELLRVLLLVPSAQLRAADELAPDGLPSTVARELYRAIVLMRAPNDQGVHPPFDREQLLKSLDDETRALALALYAQTGPDPRDLSEQRVHYAIDSCLLGLEADRIEERSEWNLAQQAEAERNGDTAEMQRLLAQERQINEERRSLDRRRDQARLLTRSTAVRP
jgi:DNA primase